MPMYWLPVVSLVGTVALYFAKTYTRGRER
jgi:hypothetical protein